LELFLLAKLLSDVWVVFRYWQESHEVQYTPQFVRLIEIYELLWELVDVGHGDLIVNVASDPWVLQGLLNSVAVAWLQTAKLLNEVLREIGHFDTLVDFQTFKFFYFLAVLLFVFSLLHDWVLPTRQHFKKDETAREHINWLGLASVCKYLLWRLVDQSSTSRHQLNPRFNADCKAEVNYLHGF
jgi:hypothetical protein